MWTAVLQEKYRKDFGLNDRMLKNHVEQLLLEL